MGRQTNVQTDNFRQKGRHTGRQTCRQADRKAGKEAEHFITAPLKLQSQTIIENLLYFLIRFPIARRELEIVDCPFVQDKSIGSNQSEK